MLGMWVGYMRRVLRRRWCTLIAFVTTLLTASAIFYPAGMTIIPWADSQDWSWGGFVPRTVAFVIGITVIVTTISFLPMAVCIASYHYLAFGYLGKGKTFCGHCGGLLRNLTEPKCPSCGEAI